MNPVTLLKAELAGDAEQQLGEIVAIDGTVARVKTPAGIFECKIVDAVEYLVGHNVSIRNGIVVSRIARQESIKTYFV